MKVAGKTHSLALDSIVQMSLQAMHDSARQLGWPNKKDHTGWPQKSKPLPNDQKNRIKSY